MKLYIVRHGQTDWNKNKRLQGQVDIKLNQTGIDSATRLKQLLETTNFDLVISSPLSRAYQTAELFNQSINNKYQIETDKRLIERSFGSSEGIHYEKVEQIPIKPDFETDEQLQTRILEAINSYQKKEHKQVLIFTHVHIIIQLLTLAKIKEPSNMIIHNCAVLEFTFEKEICYLQMR